MVVRPVKCHYFSAIIASTECCLVALLKIFGASLGRRAQMNIYRAMWST